MDRGTDTGAYTGHGAGDDAVGRTAAGRVPLAVVVVDRGGLVSHWSTGARRLFGTSKDDAVGRPALDLLPVSGALPEEDDTPPHAAYGPYDGLGPDLESSLDGQLCYPSAGRARLTVPESDRDGTSAPETPGQGHGTRTDVLWWAYPLVGPGPGRLLVLAADA
jgi:PAS domain-containing protein